MRRLVRDLELEARDRRQRKDQDNQERRDDNVVLSLMLLLIYNEWNAVAETCKSTFPLIIFFLIFLRILYFNFFLFYG